MTLDREQILNADDLQLQELDVPEWGGSVFIRTLSGAERDMFEADFLKHKDEGMAPNARAKFAVLVLCDAEGTRLFQDADAAQLGQKSGAALSRIFTAAMEANYMTEEDIEELEKNSEGDLPDSSSSD